MKQNRLFKHFVICSILLQALCMQVYPQVDSQSYDKFRVLLKTGQHLEIENGFLTDSSLIKIESQKQQANIPLTDIRALDRRVGNKALLYSGIGLLIGLAIGIAVVARAEGDPNTSLSTSNTVQIVGTTAVGTLIGFIVGSMTDDWEKVSLNESAYHRINKLEFQLVFKMSL